MVGAAVVMGGLAVFAAAVFLGHLGWQYVRWYRDCRAAGERLYREAAALYRGEHEYRVASHSEWPEAIIAGYSRIRELLVAKGLCYLGAFENLTVTRVYPMRRTLCDAYVDAEGTTSLLTYEIEGRHTAECVSMTESGRRWSTTNGALDTLTVPPEFDRCVLASDSSPEQVLRRHGERLAALRAAEPQLLLVRAKTLGEVLARCRQNSRRQSSHRQAIGLTTEEEMVGGFVGTDREKTSRRIWKEFQRCRAEDRSGANQGAEADEPR